MANDFTEIMDEVVARITVREFAPECPICYESGVFNMILPCCANITCFQCYVKVARERGGSCAMCRQSFCPPAVIGLHDSLQIQPCRDEINTVAEQFRKHERTVVLCDEPEYHHIVLPAMHFLGNEVTLHNNFVDFNREQLPTRSVLAIIGV